MNFLKKLFVLISSALLITTSINIPTTSAESIDPNNFSGKDIFIGVNFGLGPVGELFSHEWTEEQLKENQKSEVKELIDDVINKMEQENNNYFSDLKDSIYTEDYLKTKELFLEGGKAFSEIAELDHDPTLDPTAAIIAIAYFVAGITVVLAGSHAIWLTFYLDKYGAGPGIDSNGTVLDADIAIKRIIETLN